MSKIKTLVLFFLLISTLSIFGIDADLRSVEIDLFIRPDGKADIFYSLDWYVPTGDMSGFYFEGFGETPVFNYNMCFADLENNQRVPLEIIKINNNKYDIILADSRRFSGQAIYFLNYGTEFLQSGFIGLTVSNEFGELFYFDWAPVQWDESLEHRTLRIILPVTVAPDEDFWGFAEAIDLRTEQYVNSANKIDYFASEGDRGTYYFTIRFHQDNVSARSTQRIQFYIPKEFVPVNFDSIGFTDNSSSLQRSNRTDKTQQNKYTEPEITYSTAANFFNMPINQIIIVVVFLFITVFVILLKSRSCYIAVER